MSSKQLKERLQQLAPLSPEGKPGESKEPEEEKYEHITLTDEETETALRLAREAKYYHIQRVRYQEELNKPKKPVRYTAEEYYKAFTNIFPVDEENDRPYMVIVKSLCAYFAGDKRFETANLKLNKGILLFGGVGVGKTTLLHAFRQNMAFSYRIVSCRDIESEFSQGGDSIVQKYSFNFKIPTNSNPYGHQEIGYCFDDLGTETSVSKYYGKAKNVMSEIILNRYDHGLDGPATHITTNLSEQEIEEVYGTRVIDRIRGSFNIIAFPENAKSRR